MQGGERKIGNLRCRAIEKGGVQMVEFMEVRNQCACHAQIDALARDIAATSAELRRAFQIGTNLLHQSLQDRGVGLDELCDNLAEGLRWFQKLPQHQGKGGFFAEEHLHKFMDMLTYGLVGSALCAKTSSMLLTLTCGNPKGVRLNKKMAQALLIKPFFAAKVIADGGNIDSGGVRQIANTDASIPTDGKAIRSYGEKALAGFYLAGRICLPGEFRSSRGWFAGRHTSIETIV